MSRMYQALCFLSLFIVAFASSNQESLGAEVCFTESTGNTFRYDVILPVELGPAKAIKFTVTGRNDAHVGFFSAAQSLSEVYEIVIGGWSNSRSVIRESNQGHNQVSRSTQNIVSATEPRDFWASAVDGHVQIGYGHEIGQDVWMEWQDPTPHEAVFVGLMTGWGATGEWEVCIVNQDGTDSSTDSTDPGSIDPLAVCSTAQGCNSCETQTYVDATYVDEFHCSHSGRGTWENDQCVMNCMWISCGPNAGSNNSPIQGTPVEQKCVTQNVHEEGACPLPNFVFSGLSCPAGTDSSTDSTDSGSIGGCVWTEYGSGYLAGNQKSEWDTITYNSKTGITNTLKECQDFCEQDADCVAIDYREEMSYCNLRMCGPDTCSVSPSSNFKVYTCVGAESDSGARSSCDRPSTWCSHIYDTYFFTDCDGDGIPDPVCSDSRGHFGVIGSANGCEDSWPFGTCTRADTAASSGSNFFVVTGDCDVQGDCVSSKNYPSPHGDEESCLVTMLRDAAVTTGSTFNLETCCDHLVIGGVDTESSGAVPTSLSAGETFWWTTDMSVTRGGWQLCFSEESSPPNVQGAMCRDRMIIPGSDDWLSCDHDNTYTCNGGSHCCCESGFEPNEGGYCVACGHTESQVIIYDDCTAVTSVTSGPTDSGTPWRTECPSNTAVVSVETRTVETDSSWTITTMQCCGLVDKITDSQDCDRIPEDRSLRLEGGGSSSLEDQWVAQCGPGAIMVGIWDNDDNGDFDDIDAAKCCTLDTLYTSGPKIDNDDCAVVDLSSNSKFNCPVDYVLVGLYDDAHTRFTHVRKMKCCRVLESILPTVSPTQMPTTDDPSQSPTVSPSTSIPSLSPTTNDPSVSPSQNPTTDQPTNNPSVSPSTEEPSASPSLRPTVSDPTYCPSTSPSKNPTTETPTVSPTVPPSTSPTYHPSISPSKNPTTETPTVSPSVSPSTNQPTKVPSSSPSTEEPSVSPTTEDPSSSPTVSPSTDMPTKSPSQNPTTDAPSAVPSTAPTLAPTVCEPTCRSHTDQMVDILGRVLEFNGYLLERLQLRTSDPLKNVLNEMVVDFRRLEDQMRKHDQMSQFQNYQSSPDTQFENYHF